MEKLITRKEAAEILGISIATLDAARNNGLKYNRPDELVRSMNCAFASWDAAQ